MKFIKVIASKALNVFTKTVRFVADVVEKVINMTSEETSFKAKAKAKGAECEVEVGTRTWYAATGLILAGIGTYAACNGQSKMGYALLGMSATILAAGMHAHSKDQRNTARSGRDAAEDMRRDMEGK